MERNEDTRAKRIGGGELGLLLYKHKDPFYKEKASRKQNRFPSSIRITGNEIKVLKLTKSTLSKRILFKSRGQKGRLITEIRGLLLGLEITLLDPSSQAETSYLRKKGKA